MTIAIRSVCGLLLAWFAGCASVPSDDSAGVHEAVRRIIAADNARDLDAAVACYTADAEWLPPQEPPVVGRDALRARYASMFAAFQPEITCTIDETWALGDNAAVRGRTGGRLVAREGGTVRALDDKFLMILQRDPDGVWRILRLMWSPNQHD